jgi:hypothetical protein
MKILDDLILIEQETDGTSARNWRRRLDRPDTVSVKQQAIHAGPSREPTQPRGPLYLRSGYLSRVKGGTVIAGDVSDRDQHAQRLISPDGYRPGPCARCHRKMHAHGTRTRTVVGERPLEVRRYLCPGCGAVVQVLPGFLARHLWQEWSTVEAVLAGAAGPRPTRIVPPRTRRRWRARARTPASTVLHLLSSLRRPALLAVVAQVGHAATRLELLHAFRPLATALGALASLTILLNLALPGLRMM